MENFHNDSHDPWLDLKASQKESWASFAPMEMNTIIPAARLVNFSQLKAGQYVLDVGCGTGPVAITAACMGAKVCAMDLSPVLLKRAHYNASIARTEVNFIEADVEALPYGNETFDVVLSQYGHMFAPRPLVAIGEMLRVLKPGGIIAFSTWPPEHLGGRIFSLVNKFCPAPSGVASPPLWGDPTVVRERLAEKVKNIMFERDIMMAPTLSKAHYIALLETTIGPLIKLINAGDSVVIKSFRVELNSILSEYFIDNTVRNHYLLTKAIKI